MKAFWSLMAVLLAATIGLFVFDLDAAQPEATPGRAIEPAPISTPTPAPETRPERAPRVSPESSSPEPDITRPAPVEPEPEPTSQVTKAPAVEPAESITDEDASLTGLTEDAGGLIESANEIVEAGAEMLEGAGTSATEIASTETASSEAPAEEAPAEELPVEVATQVPAETNFTGRESAETEAAEADPSMPTGMPSTPGDPATDPLAAVAAAAEKAAKEAQSGTRGTVERTASGLLIDDRFTIPGSGTREDPYRITWDLLVSAERVYAPRQGKKELPAWADELDGSFVSLPGYMLLPSLTGDVTELLVMLNAWDGCCIGVPPTPYDATEVRLRQTISEYLGGGAMYVNHATVIGKLDVDPYLAGGWLLGLYVIEDADLVSAGGVGDTGN